jgi:hypothetical protein
LAQTRERTHPACAVPCPPEATFTAKEFDLVFSSAASATEQYFGVYEPLVSHLELSFELPYPELESRLLAIFRNASLAVRVSAEREECYGCSFQLGMAGDSTKILLSPLALHD